MTYIGSVDRLGLGSPASQLAGMFVFDDAIVVVPLGAAVKPGFKANKKHQAAFDDAATAADLSPDVVRSTWDDTLTIVPSDIRSGQLRRSLQGGLFGTTTLTLDDNDGGTFEFLAHRSVKDPLGALMTGVLGDRFVSSV